MIEPRPEVQALAPYSIPPVSARINLSANESPFNLPADLVAEIKEAVDKLQFNRYPDPLSVGLREDIASAYGLAAANVAVGNGADELIFHLILAYGGPGRYSVTFEPTFVMYSILARLAGCFVKRMLRSAEDFGIERATSEALAVGPALTFVCTPNNPTGNAVPKEAIKELCELGQGLVITDEAYGEFGGDSALELLSDHPNLVILKTFSKAFSLAGLRVGYLLASKEVVSNIFKVKLPFHYPSLSQEIARLAWRRRPEFEERIASIVAERDRLIQMLKGSPGVQAFPSVANFILIRTGVPAQTMWGELLNKGILVRDVSDFPLLENCIRVTVGTREENVSFLEAFEEIVGRLSG